MSPLFQLVAVTVIIALMIERVIWALCFREVSQRTVEVGTQTDLPRVSIPTEEYVVAATGSAYHIGQVATISIEGGWHASVRVSTVWVGSCSWMVTERKGSLLMSLWESRTSEFEDEPHFMGGCENAKPEELSLCIFSSCEVRLSTQVYSIQE